MGKDKKLFNMYKFRTLPVGAQQKIGAELLAPTTMALPRYIRIIRDTRLDELPQLFNVLRGDMNFIGPRPERPEIYESKCRDIPGYEARFRVKPGLIGYAQLFTPHSAPKRIRSFIDGKLIEQDEQLFGNAVLVLVTAYFMSKRLLLTVTKFLAIDYVKLWLLRRIKNQRALERVEQSGARLYAGGHGRSNGPPLGTLIDMNATHVKFHAPEKVSLDPDALCVLEKDLTGTKRPKSKQAAVRLTLMNGQAKDGGYVYLARYTPDTSLDHYKVDQYFLELSIIPPWRLT